MAYVNVKSPFPGAPSKAQITEGTLGGIRNKLKDYAKFNNQANTGNKYNEFAELSKDGLLKQYMELYKKQNQTFSQIETNKIVGLRLQSTDVQLDRVMNEVITMQKELTEAQSPAKVTMNLEQIIKGHLGTIKSILNSKEGGKALFGGFDQNDDPVNDIVNISNLVDGEATSSYTVGSQADITYEINGTNEITYNVVASDEAFVQIIGSCHLALEGKISESFEMLSKGRKLLSQTITEVGNNARLITDATELLRTQKLAIQTEYNELFSADQNEAAILASQTLDSIRNSQWIMARILSSSLIDMLRD
ncbi:MAG: hypothetical protein K0R02_23 [Rickettsiaceae bacterium]|jgi:hypothetical protein|nr:hypothetical protein [Rickettsiaceae bacterium]